MITFGCQRVWARAKILVANHQLLLLLFSQVGEVRLRTLQALEGLYSTEEFMPQLESLTERFKVGAAAARAWKLLTSPMNNPLGPFTHAMFDAISRTKRTLPYPARMLFSRSIAWIGKKVITY